MKKKELKNWEKKINVFANEYGSNFKIIESKNNSKKYILLDLNRGVLMFTVDYEGDFYLGDYNTKHFMGYKVLKTVSKFAKAVKEEHEQEWRGEA